MVLLVRIRGNTPRAGRLLQEVGDQQFRYLAVLSSLRIFYSHAGTYLPVSLPKILREYSVFNASSE